MAVRRKANQNCINFFTLHESIQSTKTTVI